MTEPPDSSSAPVPPTQSWQHPAARTWEQLRSDCRVMTGRVRGPGGQRRNKVETAVTIEHVPTGIRVRASERRNQAANRQVAQRRLRRALAIEHRDPPGDPRALAAAVAPYRTASGLRVSEDNPDFPTVLAAVLDLLAWHEQQVGPAAAELQLSTGQLIRFLKRVPAAWEHVNRDRRQSGLRPLK